MFGSLVAYCSRTPKPPVKMAATPRTMAEVLKSSPPYLSSTNNQNTVSNEISHTGSGVVDNKDENQSSNIMSKTFPYLTITVYIPTACVGVLIGKRGSNIDSIQKLAARESTKSNSSSRGPRNKSAKQNKINGGNQKPVSPESVRISVVNSPPPTDAQQAFEYYKNPHNVVDSGNLDPSSPSQNQHLGGSSMMDMGVPPTYTELDFSDPHWTPIVIRADPIASIYAANAIHDICCPEYVSDRTQLVYIMDVPVPAVALGNSNNANLRHASIVGKRGNKLIQLSADHKCRIMVPPKQLGHNVIQLEAPLKECCSCLKAISAKLQAVGPGNEEKEQQHGDATKASAGNSPSKNGKNNATNNKGNKNKNDNKNNFQMTLTIQPLPSQTKLRNIARKTETKILKKRIPKSQRNQRNQQPQQDQKQNQDQELKHVEQSMEEAELGDQQEQQEPQEQETNNNNATNVNNDNKVSWRLTVIANSEKKVAKAVDMLKVLNSKGYEVVVEESGAKNYVDSSSKTVSESTLGGSEDDADMIAATDIPAVDSSKPSGNNNRGGGRGGRGKKPRHKNWMKRDNGKGDNNMNNNGGKQQQQQTPSVSTTVVDS